MSRNKRAILLCLCLSLLLLCACSAGETDASATALLLQGTQVQPEAVVYDTVTVERQSYTQTQTMEANLSPQPKAVRLEADNVRFVEFYTSTGKWVQEGDLIATFSKEADSIRMEEIRLEIRRLEKALEDSLPAHDEAMLELEEELSELAFYEREDIQILETRIRLQELSLEQLRLSTNYQIDQLQKEYAQLEEAEDALQVYAPLSGYVASTAYIREGALCYKGQLLFTIYRPEDFLLSVNNSMGRLRMGMEVKIEFGKKNERQALQGRVVSAANCLPSTLASEYAFVQLESLPFSADYLESIAFDPSTLLSPTVTAEVLRLENALVVPRRALLAIDAKYQVSILDGESVHKRFVQPILTSTDMVWVEDGVSAGQVLILE